MSGFALLAIFSGACIAIQAAMNAELGVALNSSLKATCYAFLTSSLLVGLLLLGLNQPLPNDVISKVPWYSWFSFVFSVVGVGSLYYLIPKMGVANLMSYALTGQVILAMIISHYGLFSSPIKMVNISKLIGAMFMIFGIMLINRGE
ncbi:DMT family transporter [Catenovulum sp. 2E275]|uniref:DMT family transporter n=1 Tax=Catenovulum sp. 2E275 TaxID=2980497 RepID=UPI0021D041B8|nr:DMT family transporter [Catenovulum sp. 2E275]MCU4675383.1 DMT family transporter [Catenovulum sp. 2E275]